MLTVFGSDQVLCDVMVNTIETGATTAGIGGGTPAPVPVNVINHNSYEHSWIDAKGVSDVLDFLQNVLMLDNEKVPGLKEEGIEFPTDFGKFDSTSTNANFKSMRNNNVALSGLS